jgi:outer membrane receptor for ferrienterochelin and colicins
MPRRGGATVGGAVLLMGAVMLGAPSMAQPTADRNAEAGVYFERGNRLLERAMRARGARRERLLEDALQSYVDSLRIVRSRNAVFNAALALEELDRLEQAFAYYTEYLAMPGLSEDERSEAGRRRDALRDRVAVVEVHTDPPGAQVRVDRLDLAPQGVTPLALSLPPGDHVLHLHLPHHERARLEVTAEKGHATRVHASLVPEPVTVHIQAEADGAHVTVDDEAVSPNAPVRLTPGRHTVRLEAEGRPPVVREIDVSPGAGPMTVRLELPPPPPPPAGALAVHVDTPAAVNVNGEPAGRGRRVRVEVAPGRHQVRVEAPGRAPYTTTLTVEPGRATELRVTLAEAVPDGKRFGTAPRWLGIGTAGLGVTAAGLMIHARNRAARFDDFVQERCPGTPPACASPDDLERLRELDRELHRANLVADLFLWTTVALGATTLVLALLNREREQPPSRGRVSLAPLPGGAMLGATVLLGSSP